MVGMILYRIETVKSASRFVDGIGILSGCALAARNANKSGEELLEIPADIPDPRVVEYNDPLLCHLRGDKTQTPFISTTPDIYRALTIAEFAVHKTHRATVDNTYFFVIDGDKFREPPFHAFDYQFYIDRTRYTHDQINGIRDIETYTALNTEFLAKRIIPADAIIKRMTYRELLQRLPIWLLRGPEKLEHVIPIRFDRYGIHMSWIMSVREKFEKRVEEGRDVSGPSRVLAVKILGDNEEENMAERVEELYDVLFKGPKKPVNF